MDTELPFLRQTKEKRRVLGVDDGSTTVRELFIDTLVSNTHVEGS